MTATEELRRMLDERGVEWHGDIITFWGGADAVESVFADNALDVSLYAISPEQAIEATLGRGTCRIEYRSCDWYCTGCGEMVGTCDATSELCIDGNAIELWRYCPNCGRRVVAGDES